MTAAAPGDQLARRVAALCAEAVERCGLDLGGRSVLTEAATGAYASTAVLAALSGAEVTAFATGSRHGTAAEVREWTLAVARAAGVGHRIEIVEEFAPDVLGAVDVVTNSGHLRPLDETFISYLKPGAVVPLMMESWEIGAGRADVDLEALTRRGIAFAGTNEREPLVGVFDHLGVMAVKLLADSGIAVHGDEILLLCDNPFAPFLVRTLTACGASVVTMASTDQLDVAPAVDAVLVSLTPADAPRLTRDDLAVIARNSPAAVVVQFFGDVDRAAAREAGLVCLPDPAPPHGHMGILPSAIGPAPIVRLQSGGLRVAQTLLLPEEDRTEFDRRFLDG